MYSNTRFGELLKALPKQSFQHCVQRHQGDKHSKGFRCFDQLIAMMYAQLSDCRSLRELEAGFNAQGVHHYHLGTRTIKRSTLSDANAKRSVTMYSEFCSQLLTQVHRRLKREVNDLLYVLDSTPLRLTGHGYDWVDGQSQPHIPGLKLHVLYAHDQALPCQVQITASNVNDIEYGRGIIPESKAMYVFDKGYCDYNWWHQLDQSGSHFVTRFKRNAALSCLEQRPIDRQDTDTVLADELVCFKNKHPGGDRINHYMQPLRRIVVHRADHPEPLIIATNDLIRRAGEIAQVYKQRWGIELWFKWLKQRLKIKQFFGRSDNAVRIQILIALITYLLLYQYHKRSHSKQHLYLWLAELRATLFQRPENEYIHYKKRKRQTHINLKQQTLIPI